MMGVNGKNLAQNLMGKESRPCRVNGSRPQSPAEHTERGKQQANGWPLLVDNYVALYITFPEGKSVFLPQRKEYVNR